MHIDLIETFLDLMETSSFNRTAERLGIGFEALHKVNPRLVYASIFGLGERYSEYEGLKAMDIIIQALSGVMSVTGEPDGDPTRVGVPIADMFSANVALTGILAAIIQRGITGEGQHVKVSMLECMSALLAVEHFDVLERLGFSPRTGNQLNRLSPFGLYPTRDGHVAIAAAADKWVWSLFEAMKMPDAAEASRKLTIEEQQKSNELKAKTEASQRIVVENLAKGLAALSRGDLTAHLSDPFPEEFETLRKDFNRSVEQLESTLNAISASSATIGAGAAGIRSGADELAKRSEQQAASVEETAAALDEITATVNNTSKRAESAVKLVVETRANAERSGHIVNEAIAAMDGINESSGRISSIIGVIDEIAFQTNLLALNAGVEAARAGEAGKGFAVVAQEVRELAQRSASAAKEIKGLIGNSSAEVETGVEQVNKTGESLEEIQNHVERIRENIASIVSSAREQSAGLQDVNAAVSEMDKTTQQNAAMAEETNAASQTLGQQAAELRRLVDRFTLVASAHAKTGPREAANARPVSSPARDLGRKLAGAFGVR